MKKDKNIYQYSGIKKKGMFSLSFHLKGLMHSDFAQHLPSKEAQKFMNLTEMMYLKILQRSY